MKNNKTEYSTKEVCSKFDVTKTTLFKWEKEGKLNKVQKDWRGWRLFSEKNVSEIREIIENKIKENK